MKTLGLFLIPLGLLVGPSASAQDVPKFPEPAAVLDSMERATAFYRSNLSFAGGYARAWSRDLKESHGESAKDPTLISIQPHGTTTVGLTMLRAHAETGDPLFLQGAKEAADALAWCQMASGGWAAEFKYELRSARRYHYRRDIEASDLDPGKRSARSSLDDNKTQSAIRFLMEFANSPAGAENTALQSALDFAWDGLLAAQAPNGGWAQHFSGPADPALPVKAASFPAEWSRTFPAFDYTRHYTLNDNNLVHVMDLLLDAYQSEKTDNERFLEAAKRLGDFLLLAQLPEPQPAWAQQYDDNLHPAWARKFEPPSVCSLESLGAIETLVKIWIATGDEKYIETLPAAFAWLERSELKNEKGTWARLYELQTNQPLYLTAETYEVTHDDSNLPTHYGFKVELTSKIKKLKEIIARGRDENLEKQKRDVRPPENEKEWSDRARKLASKARDALKNQKKEGYWVKGAPIDAGEFVRHMAALTSYLEASKKGGETFSREREKEAAKARAKAAEVAAAKAKEKAQADAEAAKKKANENQ